MGSRPEYCTLLFTKQKSPVIFLLYKAPFSHASICTSWNLGAACFFFCHVIFSTSRLFAIQVAKFVRTPSATSGCNSAVYSILLFFFPSRKMAAIYSTPRYFSYFFLFFAVFFPSPIIVLGTHQQLGFLVITTCS